jgi:threonine dehydrogenase-like Zn-dependent dehydrogenase
MRALTTLPGRPGSLRVEHVPEPPPDDGEILVQTQAIGLCGTDREISAGAYGSAPEGSERLILGHESIGRVVEAPAGSDFVLGDWVAGIVRRPDPVPCASCAAGEWDMCQNGLYTERGIQGRHGFGSDRYRTESRYLVKLEPELGLLGVLLEPASVVAKAWEHIDHMAGRMQSRPKTVLVTGAGPIGLLAALFGVQRGLTVHVFDRAEGEKPKLVRNLGATYHSGDLEDMDDRWDIVVECTGAPALFLGAIEAGGPDGIVCLTGVSAGKRVLKVDAAGLNREMVLENKVVVGTVNANRRHYERAAAMLAQSNRTWLENLITRRVPIEQFAEAFERRDGDVKTILTF